MKIRCMLTIFTAIAGFVLPYPANVQSRDGLGFYSLDVLAAIPTGPIDTRQALIDDFRRALREVKQAYSDGPEVTNDSTSLITNTSLNRCWDYHFSPSSTKVVIFSGNSGFDIIALYLYDRMIRKRYIYIRFESGCRLYNTGEAVHVFINADGEPIQAVGTTLHGISSEELLQIAKEEL